MKRAVEEILKFNEERDWDQFHNPENLANPFVLRQESCWNAFNGIMNMISNMFVKNLPM